LENLRRRVFFNLETAQKASYKHAFKINTVTDLVESVVFAVKNNITSKEFYSRRKVALEEVTSLLRDELGDIRLKIALGVSSYADTIKALTDAYVSLRNVFIGIIPSNPIC